MRAIVLVLYYNLRNRRKSEIEPFEKDLVLIDETTV